ncbi:Hydrolase MutT1 [Brachybacterium faecium]|uniref:ADP-ribose pyrophosphatase n=1 Tax=Brachybacterium faecium (strain ATCC 43885 / DSM 4810 / JCM 11609 / LMG 19847 / NBRC 14762 / NCIMB 9860 / 6-10) TaxID=446465 RepID=C7MGB2_BRAFD|nr:NUDIX hydrolase [Brachybacterium faecium]ACU86345.1 ADP-ribose pyrophosphatase [Brachybacterium faecium DSM 4810]SLN03765.1 Hydrolase MutT1 [Brachybacterium faecium]HJG53338.1 NUDIX hydrolase [Brachybacterium faecium]
MRVAPGTSPPVLAAGALAWREKGEGVQVLLVHRPRYDDWSIPKGKLDKGETFPAAAVREVAEETGYRVRLQRPLPASVYLLPDGRTKIVQYWSATVRAKVAPGPENRGEVDQARWVPLEEAEALVARQTDQVPLGALRRYLQEGELDTVPIIIQRHGAALSRSKWRKGEKSRPLNGKGKKQARALPPLLDAFDPASVLSSPWERCRATVEPLATMQGLKVRTKSELTEAGHAENPPRTAAVIARVLAEARPTVVCTHRPVLPTVIDAVRAVARQGAALELPREDPFLAAGEALLLHTTAEGTVVAIERHLPNIG